MEPTEKSDVVAEDSQVELDLASTKFAPKISAKQNKMYDIDNPPEAGEQFAIFPDRAKGNDNLAYILLKMEDSTEHVPIVFCTDCAAGKYIQYCNGLWEYQYEACDVDKDL